jgi:hypothetical protein
MLSKESCKRIKFNLKIMDRCEVGQKRVKFNGVTYEIFPSVTP